MTDIVAKLWGFCHTLRHDGVDYGDYIEHLTYLLFLKMADERRAKVPDSCDWATGGKHQPIAGHVLRKVRDRSAATSSGWRRPLRADFRTASR